MKFGVVVFPGSNCDHDTFNVIADVARQPVEFLWHESEDLHGVDAVLVPGGFAYGDYLRTGAIARFSPVMQAVKRFANGGGLVLGICNGFQILTEAGLLPGALMRNAGLKYICKQVHVRVETADSPFTCALQKRTVLRIPIGHMEGNYFCAPDELARLEREDRIAFRYVTAAGEATREANPNGSLESIAGILNEGRNVLGMMPHPDRSSEALLGSADGWGIFRSMLERQGIGIREQGTENCDRQRVSSGFVRLEFGGRDGLAPTLAGKTKTRLGWGTPLMAESRKLFS